eukprot:g1439.t1
MVIASVEECLSDIGGIYEKVGRLLESGGDLSVTSFPKIVEKYFKSTYGTTKGQRVHIHFVHGIQTHNRMAARIRWFGIFANFLNPEMFQVQTNAQQIVEGVKLTCNVVNTLCGGENLRSYFVSKAPQVSSAQLLNAMDRFLPDAEGKHVDIFSVKGDSSSDNISLDKAMDGILGTFFGLFEKGIDPNKAAAAIEASTEELKNAAVCIQSSWRGRKSRKQLLARRAQRAEENKAASKIQASWRGRQGRKEVKEKKENRRLGKSASYEAEKVARSLKRQAKQLKENIDKIEKERKRWQKAFSKMEAKYRATKKAMKEYKSDADDLQAELNKSRLYAEEMEQKLSGVDNGGPFAGNNDADESSVNRDLRNQIIERDLQIKDLERQLAGSRASSRWSAGRAKATKMVSEIKLEKAHKKVAELSEDLETRVRRLQAELYQVRNQNTDLTRKNEECERLKMWMENDLRANNAIVEEAETKLKTVEQELINKTSRVKTLEETNNVQTNWIRSLWLYGVWRTAWVYLYKNKLYLRERTIRAQTEKESKKSSIAYEQLKLILNDVQTQLAAKGNACSAVQSKLESSDRENQILRMKLSDRVYEIDGLNKDVSKLNATILNLNEKISNMIENMENQKQRLVVADKNVEMHQKREEFALIRLRASELRRMEIEKSFGFLAKPSNSVASEIVNLSRALSSIENKSLGGKELDPESSTIVARSVRHRSKLSKRRALGQSGRTTALLKGKATHSASLPLLKTRGIDHPNTSTSGLLVVEDSQPKGATIFCINCDDRTIRSLWETCRPFNVIEISSVDSAMKYFMKPVDNMSTLPNVLFGDIHPNTAQGQALLGYIRHLQIPYVLVGTRNQKKSAENCGAVDFVAKPAHDSNLRAAFNSAMQVLPRSRKFALQGLEEVNLKKQPKSRRFTTGNFNMETQNHDLSYNMRSKSRASRPSSVLKLKRLQQYAVERMDYWTALYCSLFSAVI